MSRARTFADLATASEAGSVANRNMIINGDMAIAQRGVSKTGFDKDTAGLFHVVDRWGLDIGTTAGAFTVTQDTDNTAPFPEALKLATTTADTSIAAGEYVLLHQSIEGINCARMRKGNSDASPITISFYVKGNAAATYGFGLRDTDNDRIYNDVFSVTTSWSRVVLTLPGDTNGEYLNHDNGASLQMYIWLHAGSTYTGGTFSSKTWADRSNWNTTVNSSNTSILDSTSRTFFITGVQMELGEVATPFENESFQDNLTRCQRYYQKSYNYATAPGTATTVGEIGNDGNPSSGSNTGQLIDFHSFYCEMRDTPDMTFYDIAGTVDKVSTVKHGTNEYNGETGDVFRGGAKNYSVQRPATGNSVNSIRWHFEADSEI